MKEYTVVVNDCAAPPYPGLTHVRSQDTDYGLRNFSIGLEEIVSGLPRLLTSVEMDYVETLAHLYAVDLACERGAGDLQWNRQIKVWLPVRDPAYWGENRSAIESIWSDLTGDDIEIEFMGSTHFRKIPRMGSIEFPKHDGVALLSGGQDSFTGALQLQRSGIRPLYVSHVASGAISTAQIAVEQHLRDAEHDSLVRCRLTAAKKPGMPFPGSEPSQRSRTFLFVGVAAVLASVAGSGRVWINENGIMALHLPLTAARVGSYSTHTASPPILIRMQNLATRVLNTPIEIENNLVALTKPEVVARAVELGGSAGMLDTVSCWQIGRSRAHCGYCSPCLMRRISCVHTRLVDVSYKVDVFDHAEALRDARARDNLTHLAMQIRDLRELSDVELQLEYPELLAGSPALDIDAAIGLHRRWGEQAWSVLSVHDVPRSL